MGEKRKILNYIYTCTYLSIWRTTPCCKPLSSIHWSDAHVVPGEYSVICWGIDYVNDRKIQLWLNVLNVRRSRYDSPTNKCSNFGSHSVSKTLLPPPLPPNVPIVNFSSDLLKFNCCTWKVDHLFDYFNCPCKSRQKS